MWRAVVFFFDQLYLISNNLDNLYVPGYPVPGQVPVPHQVPVYLILLLYILVVCVQVTVHSKYIT